MHLAKEMERRLERLVDGATAAVFRGKMHPVDMADRLIRHADFVEYEGDAGPQIPNAWEMRVNTLDIPDGIDHQELAAELAMAVAATARERAWKLAGPIAVEIIADPEVPRGLADCSGESHPGPLPAWGQLISTSPPMALDIADNRNIIGRALDSDVVANIPEVSRRHAVIVRHGSDVTIADAASVNGTFVNGFLIGPETTAIVPGDTITMGDIDFTFRLL
ncbi:MAG: DUF3662 and FHA domain-containing protein [Acidimicrobiia bacterium]|nr:MAG: DUF3662 and FHA domain-containing protein [Acidimicrobiia bacterium]